VNPRADAPEWRKYASDVALVLLAIVVTITVFFVIQRDPEPERANADATPSATTSNADRARELVDGIESILVIGDGTARIGGEAKPWPEQFAEEHDWRITNLARVGTGYGVGLYGEDCAAGPDACPSFLGSIVPALLEDDQPELIIVTGGGWDGLEKVPTRQASVRAFFTALRANFKGAGIIALSPMWLAEPLPAPLEPIQSAVEQEVSRVGGAYLDVGQPFQVPPTGADPVEFNDDANTTVLGALDRYLDRLAGD